MLTLVALLFQLPQLAIGGEVDVAIKRSVHRWQWESDWLARGAARERLLRLAPMKHVEVLDFEISTVRGFCMNLVGICDGYVLSDGSLAFLENLTFRPGSLTEPTMQEFAARCARRVHGRTDKAASSQGSFERRDRYFDPTRRPRPGSDDAPESIRARSATWRCDLTPSASLSREDIKALRSAAVATAGAMRYGCGKGSISMPRANVEDPWAIVYIDLGSPCERGVAFFRRLLTGDWVNDAFDLEGSDNESLIRRIRDAPFASVLLSEQR